MIEIIAKTISSGLIFIVLLLCVVILWKEIRRGWRRKGRYVISRGKLNDITVVYKDGVLVDPKNYTIEYDTEGQTVINFKRKGKLWRPGR